MARLYLKIYVAMLASLALFAVLVAIGWRLTSDNERFWPRQQVIRAIAEQLAPGPRMPLDEQRMILERWRDVSGFDFALFGPDGRLIADASDGVFRRPFGRQGPPDGPPPHVAHWRMRGWAEAISLPDGRTVVIARPPPERSEWRRFGPLFALLGIALAVGIAAYPVVRRLTRRLETLQLSVAALGAGDLGARVKVQGKDEVARLAETFNTTADRIETLVTANRSLLANASHELRSPLARLRMGVEALSSGPPSPEKTAELSRNIRELDQLIEEILLASRLDAAGGMAMTPETVDIVALVAEECAASDIALDVRSDSLPEVSGDPRLLRRVVRNLVENAVRYGGGTAPEAALSMPAAGRVRIDVMDRGPGVPAHERERIFEPFYRARGESEASGGVGLGLALVRQIVERHAGRVACLPREGGGSVFRVELPTLVQA
jgi:signal transduction histidine kinase